MAQTKNTLPIYQKFTTTAAETITLAISQESRNANQNSIVIDFDITLGNCTLALPSLTSLLSGGEFSTFMVSGNILAGAFPSTLTLLPFPDPLAVDSDTICGDASVTLNGLNTCFRLWAAGRHIWGLEICTPNTQS